MSWRGTGGDGGRKGYHHGNLRDALVDAAIDLIASKGPGGVTFAEAARAAGVSAAAPYRHFPDRDSLMAEVARRGFERFTTALSEAWNEGRPEPVGALMRLGTAYLGFARDEPAFYAAMFDPGLATRDFPECRSAADDAFAVLRRACESVAALARGGDKPPPLMMALHIWALSHGIASLFGRPDKARRPVPMSVQDLLEAGVLVYLDGLGIERQPAKV